MSSKSSPIESDIARYNGRSSSTDEEKVEHLNVEDVEGVKQEERVRLSRFTKEEEEAVIRKLDWHLMPLIFVLYSFSVLDRSNLGNAKIAGMSKDIDIAGNRYAWLGTIFYISCKQLPSRNMTLLIYMQTFCFNGLKWDGKSFHHIAGWHSQFFFGEQYRVFKLPALVGKD
jgi:hypothetical protein